jgi:hypothetical protein
LLNPATTTATDPVVGRARRLPMLRIVTRPRNRPAAARTEPDLTTRSAADTAAAPVISPSADPRRCGAAPRTVAPASAATSTAPVKRSVHRQAQTSPLRNALRRRSGRSITSGGPATCRLSHYSLLAASRPLTNDVGRSRCSLCLGSTGPTAAGDARCVGRTTAPPSARPLLHAQKRGCRPSRDVPLQRKLRAQGWSVQLRICDDARSAASTR